MKLFFYNSASGSKEEFTPLDPKNVKIYSCGPTVYNFNHIGNFRSYMFVDTLRRSLRLLGFTPNQTMNITDIDDKIIQKSIELGQSISEFTKPWIDAFFEDLEFLKIQKVEHYPKATDSIPEMVDIIDRLKQNRLTYEKDGSIYYSISGFSLYGALSKIDTKGMKVGARYDTDEYTKEDLRDFVLWKAPKIRGEHSWDTHHGTGRPGWHLECSAMIRKVYGSGIDIHTGGIDLLFPHHENEIAQTLGAFPEESFVKYWLHCEHLLVNGQKMAKSAGNFYTLRDLQEKGYRAEPIRYLLLSFHYRTKLNFSLERIDEAERSIQRIQNTISQLQSENGEIPEGAPTGIGSEAYQEFLSSLSDDLNTPKALASIFETTRTINQSLEKNLLSNTEKEDYLKYYKKINELLDVFVFEKSEVQDKEIEELIEKRNNARKEKNFKLSDEIRDTLLGKGIILEDTKTGVKWKRK